MFYQLISWLNEHSIAQIQLGLSFFIATVIPIRAGSAQEHWQLYADKVFHVTLRYPGEWKKSPGYADSRFEGRHGFFMHRRVAMNPLMRKGIVYP